MVDTLLFHEFLLLGLLWLCMIWFWAWPKRQAARVCAILDEGGLWHTLREIG